LRTPSILAGGGLVAAGAAAVAIGLAGAQADAPPAPPSSTPIKHVVVIFNENESFDHYFGTYPNAANPPGEPRFDPLPGTPTVNGLNSTLLANNPNTANPQRLDRSQAVTCSQNHGYGAEQQAFDGGLMDRFVQFTAGGSCTDKSIVMDYYDGNSVTALWNIAQHFAMSDNSFGTNFGPSTVGAVNLISGNTSGAIAQAGASGVENATIIGDPEPATYLDDCAKAPGVEEKPNTGANQANNVGDLLNAHHLTWGWFEGGFRPTATVAGKAVCGSQHYNIAGGLSSDYVPHHQPFEYYASTANPHHLPPSAPDKIGQTDQANHQYDLADFDTALANDNLPAVTFLKPAAFEDAHPSNSDPLDEQRFVARTLNALEESPEWSSTAVILAYDDSDGWYDHVMSSIVNTSAAPSDRLEVDASGVGRCGNPGGNATAWTDRCAYGPRQPLMVISPYAKQNFVDGSLTDQTSVLKFIEDNWQLGRLPGQSFDARAGSLGNMFDFDPNAARAPKLFLDPTTGLVLKKAPKDNPPVSDAGPAQAASHSADSAVSPTAGQPAAPSAGKTTSGKAVRLRMSCHLAGAGRRIVVSCTATGTDARRGHTAVRFRIAHGSTVLATAATTMSKGRARATLHPRRTIASGRYTLRIAITRAGGVTGLSRAITLR
jgi:phospholipase C